MHALPHIALCLALRLLASPLLVPPSLQLLMLGDLEFCHLVVRVIQLLQRSACRHELGGKRLLPICNVAVLDYFAFLAMRTTCRAPPATVCIRLLLLLFLLLRLLQLLQLLLRRPSLRAGWGS